MANVGRRNNDGSKFMAYVTVVLYKSGFTNISGHNSIYTISSLFVLTFLTTCTCIVHNVAGAGRNKNIEEEDLVIYATPTVVLVHINKKTILYSLKKRIQEKTKRDIAIDRFLVLSLIFSSRKIINDKNNLNLVLLLCTLTRPETNKTKSSRKKKK